MKFNSISRCSLILGYFYLSLFLTAYLTSCDRPKSTLDISCNNLNDLDLVLDHYNSDPLKLEAAKFLIENMPGHYSYSDTALLRRYHLQVDSFITANSDISIFNLCDSIDEIARLMGIDSSPKTSDSKLISADYLIDNINRAFEYWHTSPWLRHLDFDQFCEYVLPYKVKELQPLDNWREKFSSVYANELRPLEYCDLYDGSAYRACRTLNEAYKRDIRPGIINRKWVKVYDVETRLKVPYGMCSDFVYLTAVIFRSVGLPIACDHTPHWGNQRLGHSWNVLLAQNGKTVPFVGMLLNAEEGPIIDERLPKAFRSTYSANPDLKKLNLTGDYVPRFFRNIFQKDVTDEYVATSDVDIDCRGINGKTAYLCVFGDNDWTPVDFGEISRGKAHFKSVGRNIVYMPVAYSANGERRTLSEPFILNFDGSVTYLMPGDKTISASLDRKYPVLKYVWLYSKLIEGGEFEASDDKEFKSGVHKVHTIASGRAVGGDVSVSDTVPPCRYWRYINRRPETYGSMAELAFFRPGDGQPLEGRIIGTEGSWEDNPAWVRENLFDGNVLTSYCAPAGSGCWVGLDFGKPVKIDRILYTPRGDGNMVEPGDTYELSYWHDGHWNSLGRQTATTMSVTYDNIPEGALLLLRDLTKGKEERIFMIDENGRQQWW